MKTSIKVAEIKYPSQKGGDMYGYSITAAVMLPWHLMLRIDAGEMNVKPGGNA